MNSEDIRSAGQISCKIATFLIFMTVDISLGCLSLFMDNDVDGGLFAKPRKDANPNWDPDLVLILGSFVFPGVQVGLQLCLVFWYFSLIWKTFMFRFTVLDKLYETFRWLSNLLVANLVVSLVAAGCRLVSVISFLR